MKHVIGQSDPKCLMIPGIGISYFKCIQLIKKNPIFVQYCHVAGIEGLFGFYDQPIADYTPTLEDTLQNQKQSYVVNCAMHDIYFQQGIKTDYVLGYSMGIYAALYAGGFYSFETGLAIVEQAFKTVSKHCASSGKGFGMGLLMGLRESELHELVLNDVDNSIQIAVYNGKRTFVIAGETDLLTHCLEKATAAGAIGTRKILTHHPYHSSFLTETSPAFISYLKNIEIQTPSKNVLSPIDGQLITNDNFAQIVAGALHTPLHFDSVIDLLFHRHKVATCYETGPKESMRKLIRYINKNITVHPFTNYEET